MKAIVYTAYGSPDVLQFKEVEKPIPKKNEVLIKVHAAAVTMGDCEMRSPKIPSLIWFIVRLYFGLRKPRLSILGSYMAGVIESVGEETKLFQKGDRVFGISGMGFGAHAEYVSASTMALTVMPSNMTYEQAAPVALGLDSLHFLKKAKVTSGEKVLINGAGGGIGTYAVQLAKYYGAKVTAVDSADKLEMLTAVGADQVIDYTLGDFSKSGVTYDVIFDVVGKISHNRSLRLLNRKGRYISAIPELDRVILGWWTSLTTKKKVMTGLTSGSSKDLDYLKELIEAGKLKSVIDRCYTLEQIAEAHRYIEAGLKSGNVVISMEE